MKLEFDNLFAIAAPGLEQVCARELADILGRPVAVEAGGVAFSASLEELYRVNLWSRTASRILVRIGEVRGRDFPGLLHKVQKLPWGRFVRPDSPVTVRASSRGSRLGHTGRIAETVSTAIDRAFGRQPPDADKTSQLIIARFRDDSCQLSVDSSGELLHRRGYRTDISAAPMRETLAAGILALLQWEPAVPVYDPMCGSGTFVIEAAMKSANIAPGLQRDFAFMRWPRYRQGLWQKLVADARREAVSPACEHSGSDLDPQVVASAVKNAERAGCEGMTSFRQADIDKVAPVAGSGLVICNPPYGVRIGSQADLEHIYRQLGQLYRNSFLGWQGALFCPSEKLAELLGVDARIVATLENGGITTQLFSMQL